MSHHDHKHSRRDFLGRLGMGCAALGATSILSSITNLGLLNAAASANLPAFPMPPTNDYRALVCIMLSGGNDSYNMLVPKGNDEYNDYAASRTNMALQQSELLTINPTNPDGKVYGLHPSLVNCRDMFESGDLAFIANIGSLMAPTTVADYDAAYNLPLGLFSHLDQRQQWQTSIPDSRTALGWGGRLADILHTNNSNQNISMNVSLSGINFFQQGTNIREYSISNDGFGSIVINDSDQNDFFNSLKRQTLDNILDANYQNILDQAYSESVRGSKGNSIQFGAALASGDPITTSFGTDRLSKDLNMVAKTIAARDNLGVTKQTFFIEMGGFDTHDNFLIRHGDLMANLDTALKSFSDAMVELGLEDSVTTFTSSDFARTLVSNGNGTDHGWGGNAMVLGGSVNGQKIYGQYPDLYLNSAQDLGNGRMVPTTSCDEYFAELALWLGASHSDLDLILPNIGNFWTPTAGSGPMGLMA